MLGTIIGATFAALLVGGLHPDLAVTVLLVAFSAWVAYSTWYASFAICVWLHHRSGTSAYERQYDGHRSSTAGDRLD